MQLNLLVSSHYFVFAPTATKMYRASLCNCSLFRIYGRHFHQIDSALEFTQGLDHHIVRFETASCRASFRVSTSRRPDRRGGPTLRLILDDLEEVRRPDPPPFLQIGHASYMFNMRALQPEWLKHVVPLSDNPVIAQVLDKGEILVYYSVIWFHSIPSGEEKN